MYTITWQTIFNAFVHSYVFRYLAGSMVFGVQKARICWPNLQFAHLKSWSVNLKSLFSPLQSALISSLPIATLTLIKKLIEQWTSMNHVWSFFELAVLKHKNQPFVNLLKHKTIINHLYSFQISVFATHLHPHHPSRGRDQRNRPRTPGDWDLCQLRRQEEYYIYISDWWF